MPYPEPHFLLTIHWVHEAYPLESGQTGIRFHMVGTGNNDATQAKVDACAAAVHAFWRAVGSNVPVNYLLKYIRFAKIGTDGRYPPGANSFDNVHAASQSAGAGGVNASPLQAALVTTLRATSTNGPATKGRLYLPPLGKAVGDNGLWTATDCDLRNAQVAVMLTALNTALNATAMIYSQGTQRQAGGAGHKVVAVATGTRPDVQRRRAKGVPDVKGAPTTVTSQADPGEVLANP
jgi:hypothetical protein